MKKVFLILILLNTPIFAKEKLRGQLGANLGDNIVQAIGNENYSKFEVNYDPKFKKDYQQFDSTKNSTGVCGQQYIALLKKRTRMASLQSQQCISRHRRIFFPAYGSQQVDCF